MIGFNFTKNIDDQAALSMQISKIIEWLEIAESNGPNTAIPIVVDESGQSGGTVDLAQQKNLELGRNRWTEQQDNLAGYGRAKVR